MSDETKEPADNGKGELVAIEPTFKRQIITPSIWTMINQIAPIAYKSRLFGVTSEAAAAAIMLKGYELGLGITTAFEYIAIIGQKPTLKPIGAWSLVLSSGELEDSKIIDENDKNGAPYACNVYLKRRNGMEYLSRVTMDDARRSGSVKEGSGWANYPANMLRWRALGFAIDVVFPDIQGGMKRADEFGADLTADGNIVEAAWKDQPASNAYQQLPKNTVYTQPSEAYPGAQVDPGLASDYDPNAPENKPAIGLQDLIDRYGAEPVLIAMQKVTQGRPPANQDEVDAIAKEVGDGS